MKRFSIIRRSLLLLSLFCSFPTWLSAATYNFTAENDDGVTIYYSIVSSEDLTVNVSYASSSYNSYKVESVTIPSTVTYNEAEYEVTGIGASAFRACTTLTSVTIPETVTSIGDYAFNNCTALTEITIPEGVTSIGDYAFQKCTSLATITFGDNSVMTSIGGMAFSGCSALTEIIIPANVENIGTFAFQSCTSLTEISFPEKVTSIGQCTFARCSALTKITIPKTVITIGTYAFEYCTTLTEIIIPDDSQLTSIGDYAFYNCTALESINIPSGVTSIGGYTFEGCSNLPSITFPSTLASIGTYAFKNCTSLTSIVIPDDSQLTSIDASAFYGCTSLAEITIPEKVTSIGNYAFQGCTSLATINFNAATCSDFRHSNNSTTHQEPFYGCTVIKELNVGEMVTKIPAYFLYGISSLETLTVVENSVLETIGNYAFYDCSVLKKIFFPSSVKTIGEYSFYGCKALTEITIPENVTSVGKYSFQYCDSLVTLNFNATECENFPSTASNQPFYECTALAMVNTGANVTTIPEYFLYDISSLQTVTIADNSVLEAINSYAFYGCSKLTTVIFGDSSTLTTIASHAFRGCSALESITVPSSVTIIDTYAFYNCTSLTSINIPGGVTSIANYTFYGCSALPAISLPDGVMSIGNYAFSGCSALETVTFGSNSSLTTIGNYTFNSCIVLPSINIPASVTSIGQYAFAACSNLATVTFEEDSKLETIGDYAFNGCILQEIVLPESVISIGASAFRSSSTLAKVTFGDDSTLETIGSYAFYECTALTEITIPENVTSVGSYSFNYCTSLATLNFNATACGDFPSAQGTGNAYYYEPFYSCPALATVNIGSKVTKIPAYFLYDVNSAVPEVTFPETLRTIGKYAFYGCLELTEITIPENVTSIGTYAFDWCSSLATVIAKASDPATCGDYAFSNIASDSWLVVPEDAAENYTSAQKFQATKATLNGWTKIDHMREATVSIDTSVGGGYASCYSPYEYTLDEGLEAAVIEGLSSESTTDDDGNKILGLTIDWKYGHGENQTAVVPAKSAVLLHAINGTEITSFVNDTENTSSDLSTESGNNLHGSTTLNDDNSTITTTIGGGTNDSDYYFYKFTYGADEKYANTLGFYWMAQGGAAFDIAKKHPWLALNKQAVNTAKAQGVNLANIPFYFNPDKDVDTGTGTESESETDIAGDDATTGISLQTADASEAIIYNIGGQRVNDMNRKGIYIVNGKKIVKK